MKWLIKLNGLYDILCSLTMLDVLDIPLLTGLHESLFNNQQNEVTKRMFAYWIFTYGVVRLQDDIQLLQISYLIEAFFLLHEYNKGSMIRHRVYFCIYSCGVIMFLIPTL
jgi:hypothetical protein